MIITLIRFAIVAPFRSLNNEPTPAIGLAYIAGSCKSKGTIVKGIDSTGENLNKIFGYTNADIWSNASIVRILTQTEISNYKHNARLAIDPWSGGFI